MSKLASKSIVSKTLKQAAKVAAYGTKKERSGRVLHKSFKIDTPVGGVKVFRVASGKPQGKSKG